MPKVFLSLFLVFSTLLGLLQPTIACPNGKTSLDWERAKFTQACSSGSCCCVKQVLPHALQSCLCQCGQTPAHDQSDYYLPSISSSSAEQATDCCPITLASAISFIQQPIRFHDAINSRLNPGKLYLLYRALLI